MSTGVFFAVLGAALLHATWNAAVKGGPDKRLGMGAVVCGHTPFALVAIAIAPVPAVASIPYLIAGIALHVGYQLSLLRSYETGDLSQVYPIARGSAPLIVALVSVLFLRVRLAPAEVLAVAIIGAGLVSLALVRHDSGRRNGRAALLALTTGAFIASYSLVDGLGARAAGTSLGFYGFLALGNGIVMALFLYRTTPEVLGKIARQGRALFLLGGGASFAAYAIVTWGFMHAPIALVAALRESSIVFALLIGVLVFRERLDLAKVISTLMTLLGAALLRYARQSS